VGVTDEGRCDLGPGVLLALGIARE
jgi:hypothetical protein